MLVNYPFELVAPFSAIASILLLPLGPLLVPRFYLIFLILYFSFFLYTQINHTLKFYITARRIKKTIRAWNTFQRLHPNDSSNVSSAAVSPAPTPTREGYSLEDEQLVDMEASLRPYEDSKLTHAFIIPNYSEPEPLLRDTIKRLANHRNSQSNYVIILAMEASEMGHMDKAESLQNYFRDSFQHFVITVHPSDIPGEARGKGSNVAYAARVGCSELLKRGVDRRRIILTVSDSDSAIPELYISEVEKAFNKAEDPYFLLFVPPIFFSRNCFEVPASVRVTDITWSALVMSNLSSGRGIAFPCSTYSLTMILAEKVGYWDTDADAVGEDLHMWLKCFFKTEGLARSVPIFVPINLTNVQTTGYLANLNARYVQAKRHYNGIADLAYTLRHAYGVRDHPHSSLDSTGIMLPMTPTTPSFSARSKMSMYTSPTYWIDKMIVCVKVLEAHLIPATSGWLMFAAVPLMQFILFPPSSSMAFIDPDENPVLTSEFFSTLWNIVKIITIFLPFPLFGTLAIYEQLHRAVDRELFRKPPSESRTWKNAIDFISLPISAWLFMTIPATVGCIKRLFKTNDQYIVAEKFFSEDAESQD
ncbi:hypothetical protein BC943DRAFT_320963 [Umbelopsis sp. AD052]|nr:hypothetical protein BC943DRAFT_320963 [Umbelopsis sp. AD052]